MIKYQHIFQKCGRTGSSALEWVWQLIWQIDRLFWQIDRRFGKSIENLWQIDRNSKSIQIYATNNIIK